MTDDMARARQAVYLGLPRFSGCILEPSKWALENMGSGYGIALNPDFEPGLDMEPKIVADLAGSLASTAKD